MSKLSVDHLISLYDLKRSDFDKIFKKTKQLKNKQKKGIRHEELKNKTLAFLAILKCSNTLSPNPCFSKSNGTLYTESRFGESIMFSRGTLQR